MNAVAAIAQMLFGMIGGIAVTLACVAAAIFAYRALETRAVAPIPAVAAFGVFLFFLQTAMSMLR